MRLIMIAAVAVLGLAATALAQEPSPITGRVDNGADNTMERGERHTVGKPVLPSRQRASQRREAITMPQPGSTPRNGTERPAGTTGAPPYGSSTPKPNSPNDTNKPPYGG